MSPAVLQPCACCDEGTPPGLLVFDEGMRCHVCPECRRNGQWAKAHMARLASEPFDGLPSMLIAIVGVYDGTDAPDNQITTPPSTQ